MVHPLRVRMLSRLRTDGPATAADLARALGESRGATSYHLRQLARFGFVVDAPDGNDRRTRRWRAAAARSVLRPDLLRQEPAAAEAAVALMTSQVTPVVDAVMRTLRSSNSEWLDSVITFDHEMRLTPVQLANLRTKLREVIERFFKNSIANPEPNADTVILYLGAAPADPG